MPNRIFREGISKEKRWASLSPMARVLLNALGLAVDDHKCYEADPLLVSRTLFPYDTFRESQMDLWLRELQRHSFLTFYEVRGTRYLVLGEWPIVLKYKPGRRKRPPPPLEQGELALTSRSEADPKLVEFSASASVSADESAGAVEAESANNVQPWLPATVATVGDAEASKRATSRDAEEADADARRRAAGGFAAWKEAVEDSLWVRLCDLLGIAEMTRNGLKWHGRFLFCRDTINAIVTDCEASRGLENPGAVAEAAWARSAAGVRMADRRRRA